MAPLLGVLFAVFVALLAIRPYFAYQNQSFDNIRNANTAEQFRQIIDAATTYIQNYCLPSQSGGSNYETCNDITLSTLQGNNPQNVTLLPNNISANTPYGQTWNIVVAQQGNLIQAFVYSSGGVPIPPQSAPEIAAETGAEAGFIPTPAQYNIYNVGADTAVGAYGHWNAVLPSGLSPAPVAGDLVAQLNVQNTEAKAQDTDYLYRNQVPGDTQNSLNTMSTDLSMGGNDITDAANVKLTGGGLALTSTPQKLGSSCKSSQLGNIAPSTNKSGVPIVCSTTGSSTTPQWTSLGTGFTQVSLLQNPSQNSPILNNTGKPQLYTSSCQAQGSLLLGTVTLMLQVTDPNQPNTTMQTTSQLSYLSLIGQAMTPEASILVPAGDSFSYTLSGWFNPTCSFIVAN